VRLPSLADFLKELVETRPLVDDYYVAVGELESELLALGVACGGCVGAVLVLAVLGRG